MDRPWAQASGEKVGHCNEDGRFNKPYPGTLVGARENGQMASSVFGKYSKEFK